VVRDKAIEINNSEAVKSAKHRADETARLAMEKAKPYLDKTSEVSKQYWDKTVEVSTPVWEQTKAATIVAVEKTKENAILVAENMKPAVEAGMKKISETAAVAAEYVATKTGGTKNDHATTGAEADGMGGTEGADATVIPAVATPIADTPLTVDADYSSSSTSDPSTRGGAMIV
jgi:hypothetical protein